MANLFQVEIVSAEQELYSGKAKKLFVTGVSGELEVLDNHAPLLTSLESGPVFVVDELGNEEAFVILGGFLEVQPHVTIVLADSALRAVDIDEQAAKDAKKHAEDAMSKRTAGTVDYQAVHKELALALAQLRVVRKLRGK